MTDLTPSSPPSTTPGGLIHPTGLTLPKSWFKALKGAASRNECLVKLQECAESWDADYPETPVGFGTDVWVPMLWVVAHEASMYGRMRVLRWLVEEMGVRAHRLLLEEERLIRSSATATAAPFQTPLASAIYYGQEAAALYLLRAGAERGDIDVNRTCGEESYDSLVSMAIDRKASPRLLTALMEEGGFDPGAREGMVTALSKMASMGKVELVAATLAYARRHGRLESALTSCLDPNTPSLFTMIMEARKLEVLRHLVSTVTQADMPSYDLVHTALSAAAYAHFASGLRFLLAPERAADGDWGRPVDVNAQFGLRAQFRKEGQTLLHVVFAQGPQTLEGRAKYENPREVLETVELLLEMGADPRIRDEEGKTPIEYPWERGFGDAVRLMERVASKGQREAAARAAEAELLGLLEGEEAKASEKQQKKGKKKGKGGGGKEPGAAAAAAAAATTAAGGGAGADGISAGLAAVSLLDSDGEEEEEREEKAVAAEQLTEQPLEPQPPPLSEEEAFILAHAEAEAPDFVCPLTLQIMWDVAMASDGFSYERAAIEAHIRRCQADTAGRPPDSPKTGERIDPMLLPNRGLANLIGTWLAEQRRAFRAGGRRDNV